MAASPMMTPTTAAASTGASLSPVSSAGTSSRGVTKNSITLVFPVVALNSLAGRDGFAEDAEYGEQTKAIQLFVKQINDGGGVNGRKILPIISSYDPTNETQMRSLCKTVSRRMSHRCCCLKCAIFWREQIAKSATALAATTGW